MYTQKIIVRKHVFLHLKCFKLNDKYEINRNFFKM